MDIESPAPTSVYKYYDERSVLLYVGITGRGTSRNLEHNKSKSWWAFVTRQEVEHLPSRVEALRREKELILRHRPPFNRQHNPDREQMEAAYLDLRSRPLDGTVEHLGGVVASKAARRRVTELGHRLPLTKHRQSDTELVYATSTAHFNLACCCNLRTPLKLRGCGTLKFSVKQGNRLFFVFARSANGRAPNTVHLKLRTTQKPFTLWAFEAVPA